MALRRTLREPPALHACPTVEHGATALPSRSLIQWQLGAVPVPPQRMLSTVPGLLGPGSTAAGRGFFASTRTRKIKTRNVLNSTVYGTSIRHLFCAQ